MFIPYSIVSLFFIILSVIAEDDDQNGENMAPIYGDINEAVDNRFAIAFKEPLTSFHWKQFFEHLGLKKHSTKKAACGQFHFMNADNALLKKIRSHHLVKHVEYVQKVSAFKCRLLHANATWGVARICRDKPSKSTEYYTEASAGKGVRIYVIDTGINLNHEVFQGRAKFAANLVPNSPDTDEQGHGTCTAGLAATVSPGASIHAIKVLNKDGNGNTEWVIQGICLVADLAKKSTDRMVINLSLGGKFSLTLNHAVHQAKKAGVAVVVAAGNDNKPACLTSPASSLSALTVAATDSTDGKASYSNYGPCVNIQAPGSNLACASHTSNNAVRQASGTSLASPIVAGLLANTLTVYNISKAPDGYHKVKELALKHVIHPNKAFTPNLLANNRCNA